MLSKESVLKLDTRQRIYDFILNNPGLHINEIKRRMNIPKSTLIYHTQCLTKLDLIEEKRSGKHCILYPIKKVGSKEKQILKILRDRTCLRIYIYSAYSICFSQIELSKELELSPSIISYHLKKLLDLGVIEEIDVMIVKFLPIVGELFPIQPFSSQSVTLYSLSGG